MNNSYKEVTVVVVSHKSKKKVLNLIKNISNNFKIIIVENSNDKSIKNKISEIASKGIFSLPLYPELSLKKVRTICEALKKIMKSLDS